MSRTSPTSWLTPKVRWSAATTGKRPATRCWSAPSCMSSMPRRTGAILRGPAPPSASLLAERLKAEDAPNGGLRREPELPEHVAIVRETADRSPHEEFVLIDDEPEDTVRQARALRRQMRGLARQASFDPGDGLDL